MQTAKEFFYEHLGHPMRRTPQTVVCQVHPKRVQNVLDIFGDPFNFFIIRKRKRVFAKRVNRLGKRVRKIVVFRGVSVICHYKILCVGAKIIKVGRTLLIFENLRNHGQLFTKFL